MIRVYIFLKISWPVCVFSRCQWTLSLYVPAIFVAHRYHDMISDERASLIIYVGRNYSRQSILILWKKKSHLSLKATTQMFSVQKLLTDHSVLRTIKSARLHSGPGHQRKRSNLPFLYGLVQQIYVDFKTLYEHKE